MAEGTALVTGAGGFIGSHLVEQLVDEGYGVRALLRYTSGGHRGTLTDLPAEVVRSVDVRFGNVEDVGALQAAMRGCDIVFHLAALIGIPYSYAAPQQYVATNVVGTLNVLDAARAVGPRRVVCVSTSEVYGSARYTPIDEGHPLHAQSPYAATKIGAEKLAQSYGLSFNLPVTIVRPFNTYGPRQSARAVVPTVIMQALAGNSIKLGSLSPVRDLNYVGDTVAGMIAAGTTDVAPGSVFNIGSGVGISIGELVARVQGLCKTAWPVLADESRVRPGPSEVAELVCDATQARRQLGWRPRVDLDEGLARTTAWMRDNLDRYRVSEYAV